MLAGIHSKNISDDFSLAECGADGGGGGEECAGFAEGT